MRDLFSILGETVLRESGADKPTGFFKMRRFRDLFRIRRDRRHTVLLGENITFKIVQWAVMVIYGAFLITAAIAAAISLTLIVQDGYTTQRLLLALPIIIWAVTYYLLFRNENDVSPKIAVKHTEGDERRASQRLFTVAFIAGGIPLAIIMVMGVRYASSWLEAFIILLPFILTIYILIKHYTKHRAGR